MQTDSSVEDGWRSFARWKGAADPSAFVPCNAPFRAMSFQVDGRVLACSRKPAGVLGDVRRQSIREIWFGEAAEALRSTMRRREFPAACAPCRLLALSGSPELADLRKYESLPSDGGASAFPERLEFNLANTCNLECIHCSGRLSSAIRARRERLPPLPRAYGDPFFAQLDEFLPHLRAAVFLGGEPFLQHECHRIWDSLLARASRALCTIVTNGTVFDARVERLLGALRFQLIVSLDGATRATVEQIRRNARFDDLERNLRRFSALAARPGCSLRLAICPMRNNWHELGRFCRWADELGADVQINVLTDPRHLSLFRVEATELRSVVRGLQEQVRTIGPTLGRNKAVLERFARSLKTHLERRSGDMIEQSLAMSKRASAPPEDADHLHG